MSGAALADAAGLGSIEIREMTRRRYSKELSVGITGASAIIGPIIPPSIPMVFYAVVAGSSIGKLFIAGIIPGIITAITLGIMVIIVARKEKVEMLKRANFNEWFAVFIDTVPSLITIVILLGGIFTGLFTPTEASVVAVLYTVFLGVAYKKFNWKMFINELFNAMKTMTRVMFIVAAASLFGQVVIRTQMAAKLSHLMLSTFNSPVIILLLINLFLLILGCFLEQIAAILVVTPIILPIMTSLGISDIQSGIVIVFNLMIGLLTPPFGLVLFTLADVGQISIKKTIKGVVPFLLPLIVTLLLITFVPWVTNFLPSFIMGK
jgi:tripartite ATP-independent transporter DctM subunit